MARKHCRCPLSERQQEILLEMVHGRWCPQGLAQRGAMILESFAGKRNDHIALALGCERHTVGVWRGRWRKAYDHLIHVECFGKPGELRQAIMEVLKDQPRPGRRGTFTAEQIALIIAVACEPPNHSGRPISHWSARELADEVMKRKIVTSISARQIGRFLKDSALKPHRSRYWLNAPDKDSPEFPAQVQAVCETYQQAKERLETKGIHTVCVDEKTGMQALERISETLPMKPGLVECREYEYQRHGTQCLTANFEVATGKVIAPTVEATRNEKDFSAHVERTIRTDSKAGWIFVADNLTTHLSESLVLLVATLLGISLATLGIKGECGVLKSVATRRKFLTDPTHRIRFVYTPKHASWLNQVEIWFSVLSRRCLKRGNFRSVKDLREQILSFIEYQNRTQAKPYKWTYSGRPLNV